MLKKLSDMQKIAVSLDPAEVTSSRRVNDTPGCYDDYDDNDEMVQAFKEQEMKRLSQFAEVSRKTRDYLRRLNDNPKIQSTKAKRLFDCVT